jgi:hypothetical protein
MRQRDIKAEDFIQITDEILYLFNEISVQNSTLCVSPIVSFRANFFMEPLSDDTVQRLQALVNQGKQMLATKTMPPAKLRGDWQVMETVYSVVNREAFNTWRNTVLQWLSDVCTEDSETYWSFFDGCRVPYFLEACEGVAHVEKIARVVHKT